MSAYWALLMSLPPTLYSEAEIPLSNGHKMSEKKHGLVIIIKMSDAIVDGRKPRIVFSCEKSSTYRGSSKVFKKKDPNKATTTKNYSCPFALKGRKLAHDNDWMVTVICGVHNHPNAQYLEGHLYVGRLSEEELTVLIDMSKSLVKLRKLDLVPTMVDEPIELTTTAEFKLITKRFQDSDQPGRMRILKKLKEVASSSSKIS